MVKRLSFDELVHMRLYGDEAFVSASDYDVLLNQTSGNYWLEYNQAKERAEDLEARVAQLEAELAEARKLLERVLHDGRAYLALASPPVGG